MKLSKLAIIGPGLLGGSIALAMRRVSPATRLAVWSRRSEAAGEIQASGIAEISSTDLAPVIEAADVVVLCVPVGAMPALAEKIAPLLSPHALVTDVGSVKMPVAEKLGEIFAKHGRFVGSHPMAGSERSGLDAASADLFQNATCIVTPDADTDSGVIADATDFWQLLGCNVRLLSPAAHDDAVAAVSHLPHLLAAALVNFVCARQPDSLNFCGNGFRDTTRVAAGPPAMWAEILRANREPLQNSLGALIDQLKEVLTLLKNDDETPLRQFLAAAKTTRDRLKKN